MEKHAILIACVVATLAGCKTPAERENSWPPDPGWDLSRTRFIEEMVYPQGTARTPQFDDYTPGSYHINKLGLIDGVQEFSTTHERHVEALLILGPEGPLWTYHVITVVGDSDRPHSVSINQLVFPHARITVKTTRLVPRSKYEPLIARILAHPFLLPVSDSAQGLEEEWSMCSCIGEFGHCNPDLPRGVSRDGTNRVCIPCKSTVSGRRLMTAPYHLILVSSIRFKPP